MAIIGAHQLLNERIAFPDWDIPLPFIKLFQGFSTLALLTFRAGEFFIVEFCPVHWKLFIVASLTSAHKTMAPWTRVMLMELMRSEQVKDM